MKENSRPNNACTSRPMHVALCFALPSSLRQYPPVVPPLQARCHSILVCTCTSSNHLVLPTARRGHERLGSGDSPSISHFSFPQTSHSAQHNPNNFNTCFQSELASAEAQEIGSHGRHLGTPTSTAPVHSEATGRILQINGEALQ